MKQNPTKPKPKTRRIVMNVEIIVDCVWVCVVWDSRQKDVRELIHFVCVCVSVYIMETFLPSKDDGTNDKVKLFLLNKTYRKFGIFLSFPFLYLSLTHSLIWIVVESPSDVICESFWVHGLGLLYFSGW